VNHEVEDNVDVEAARSENAEAVDFKKERERDGFLNGENGWVEALEVADLEDAVVLGGELNEVPGALEIEGDGLLDEDVEAGFDELTADFGMGNRGHRDYAGIGVIGEFLERGEGARVKFCRCGGGCLFVAIKDAGELGTGEIFEYADVIAPECAGSGNGDADSFL